MPLGALANDTSYVSFGCVRNAPDRLSTVFFMPALRAAAPPAGIESDQNVMLCGPPVTFVKRTVAPAGMVIELGSNAARVLPLPVIFTSTTGPVDVAAAPGAAGGALCIWDWFWSLPFLPQASAPMATTVVSKAKRIAGLLRTWAENWGRVSLVVSLVNCFTIAVNIDEASQNGSPTEALASEPMRTPIALFILVQLSLCSIAAQSWTTQLGITGGVVRQKPAGTGQRDYIDRWEIPSSGAIQASLFFVRPITKRLALESNLAASYAKFLETGGLVPRTSASDIHLIVRADIALTAGAYVAFGPMLRRRQVDSVHAMQTGLLGAIGYQHEIGRILNGRIEAQWLTQRNSGSIEPSNVYALLFGFSRLLSSSPEPSTRAQKPFTPWRLRVGAAGGYARSHLYGTFSGFYVDAWESDVDLPGSTTAPPPLFVDAPLGGRFALEFGVNAQRLQEQGTTRFDGHFAPRLNVALYRGLYAAAGGNLRYLAQTGAKSFALAGANVATGYRFPVVRSLEGRVDISYTVFKERRDFPFVENTVAAMLGVAMALR